MGGFSGRRKREKAPRNGVYVLFKADRTTSKRIRYGIITVKSTTLIGLNSPRKNTTLPAIRSVEPGRTHIPEQSLLPVNRANAKIKTVSQVPSLDERTGLSPLHTETSVFSALTNKLEEINLRVERLQEVSSITARKTGPHSVTNVRIHVSTLPNSTSSATIQSSAKLKNKNIHLTASQINIDPQTNDTILKIRNDSDNIITLNKNMKIITVNNYEDFYSDFPVSQDILPPLTEKNFNLLGLDSKLKNRLFQLLISHKSAFARSTVELFAAATEHHRINLQHDYPIKCPIYKIPFNLRNEFRRQIADLEKAGIISKSNSQYHTPTLFVKQKEKWRHVLDFRKLNEITLTQDFVIPTLDDILHEISGSNYFSALDMKSAFNQIPLHLADRHKTAFSTPDGDKYEFKSIAQEVLGDLLHNGALVYIDDVILFTKTIDEHFDLLVTPEGILIDKDKSVSINEFPVPTDQKQIKYFLGCCNFYRRYIKNFAKRALPLTNLLRKDTPFEWTSETQEAFDDIKKAILNPPVLTLPDPNAELQITTDASSRGIGAVLEQSYPNSEVKRLYFFQRN
ncbi:retrovirus-related Pol polyprotein from transposon 17.6 [Trichonephila clavipes]|nr:retrovirus-related Pol polyprotein from transposon 17.6 [Trichonephila clavipes]